MHAVVVGCGRVGAAVASAVEAAGHTVAVLDKDRDAFRRLAVGFRGRRVVGLGFDRDRLLEAGIESAGALAAVTNGDNSNIVVARVAHETFRVPRVVARIYDPRRAVIYERLGIPTIAPVRWSADRVLERILPGAHGVHWSDPGGGVVIVERTVTEQWGHRSVSTLEQATGARVAALTGQSSTEAGVPAPDDALAPGDVVWLAVGRDALAGLDRALLPGERR